jgi:hypothetical protein
MARHQVVRRPRVAADRIDSIYVHDTVRVFQHVFFRVRDPQDVREVRATGGRIPSSRWRDSSADFAAPASARSEDPTTASSGGWLPVGPMRHAAGVRAGRLAPRAGRVDCPVTQDHIVRRYLAEARPADPVRRNSLATSRADARYLDSLTTATGLAVSGQAVASLRAFFANPSDRSNGTVAWHLDRRRAAARGRGPMDRPAPPRGYLGPPGQRSRLEAFVKEFAQQELMLAQARAAGIAVTPAERRRRLGLRPEPRRRGRQARGIPRRRPPQGSGTQRVATLLEGLTSDQERWRPLPGALGAVLRERGGYRLHQAGIAAALEAARTVRAAPQ